VSNNDDTSDAVILPLRKLYVNGWPHLDAWTQRMNIVRLIELGDNDDTKEEAWTSPT
jgi:hypothetical protein